MELYNLFEHVMHQQEHRGTHIVKHVKGQNPLGDKFISNTVFKMIHFLLQWKKQDDDFQPFNQVSEYSNTNHSGTLTECNDRLHQFYDLSQGFMSDFSFCNFYHINGSSPTVSLPYVTAIMQYPIVSSWQDFYTLKRLRVQFWEKVTEVTLR